MLAANYVDVEFRAKALPGLVEQYRGQAATAATIEAHRAVVHEFLSHVPASHLGLLSAYGHRALMADLLQAPYPAFGFQVIGAGADRYAGMVLEGGPAARAGLLHGDRLVTVDGTPILQSTRLDWRTDDAHIGDDRDPSVQYLVASAGDRIALRVERRPGEFVTVNVMAEDYTAFDAAEASVRIIRTTGKSVGYAAFLVRAFHGRARTAGPRALTAG